MSNKGGNFFEEHVEKIVLAVVVLVCLWLFITRALFSPNKVEYEGRKLGPGEIDLFAKRRAAVVQEKLSLPPEGKGGPEQYISKFIDIMSSPIRDVDITCGLDLPPHFLKDVTKDNRKYSLPEVGEIVPVVVEHIRAVAHAPTVEINKENFYSVDNSEPNDIDFVTVESSVDIGRLRASFHECFAGEDVPKEWRDARRASPVFAAVQLQRRELLGEGRWSDWQILPRAKIDHRKEMFEIIEDAKQLPPGGIQVRLLNFDNKQAMVDLLQPEAYRIASAGEEWFPPSVHKKYAKYQKQIEAQERREAMEAKKKEREEKRDKLRWERPGLRPETGSGSGRISARLEEAEGGRYPRGMRPRGGRGDREWEAEGRRERSETDRERTAAKGTRGAGTSKKKSTDKDALETKSIKDFYDEYQKMLIGRETDIAKMQEALVFWAHDDTVEPGTSYQYRIRLGVFNPIAGSEQVSEKYKGMKDQVILWSDYSDVTESVDIPARLYFFPHRMQELAEIVTVRVCRYVLGYWYSENFRVKHGEVIGKVTVFEPEDVEDDESGKAAGEITIPETIDFSTGAIYVDAIAVNNWVGGRTMRPKSYHDMLYSYDGTNIEHIPIGRSYWAKGLQSKFNEIEELERRPRKPLRDWGAKPAEYKRRTPKWGDEEYEDEEYEREEAAGRTRRW